ncbi:MAG: chromate transporter, partial [Pseudomonadota bacterium]
ALGALAPALLAAGLALAALLSPGLPGLGTLGQLFTGFARTGLLMFGGGYTAVPLFQQLAVEQHGWIDPAGLAEAIALSQLTPGPILTSAGYIGQTVAGLAGNASALAGMFLPMAIIAVLLLRSLENLAGTWWMAGFLHGVRPAALAAIAAGGLLLLAALPDPARSLPVAAGALYLLLGRGLPTYWLIPLAGGVGLLLAGLTGT